MKIKNLGGDNKMRYSKGFKISVLKKILPLNDSSVREVAKEKNIEIKVTGFPWISSGRAVTLGFKKGLTKLIIDPRTERILGAGIVGTGAGELIPEVTLAIELGARASDLALTIHPLPALSETIMEAAEMFCGEATDIYWPQKHKNRT